MMMILSRYRLLTSAVKPRCKNVNINSIRLFSTSTSSNAKKILPEGATASFHDAVKLAQKMNRRQLGYAAGALGLLTVTAIIFAPELKGGVSKHTAEVASRSLQDEQLQIQTSQLASDIVQTVLTNPKVLDQASQFLSHLVALEKTQESLVKLTRVVLEDPHTLATTTRLAKQLIYNILQDPATLQQFVELLKNAIVDPGTKASVVSLLEMLMKDEPTMESLSSLVAWVFVQETVTNNVTGTLTTSVHTLLDSTEVQDHAKTFVSDVMQDRTVQSSGGDALWGTVWYSVTPRWISWLLWGKATVPERPEEETLERKEDTEEKIENTTASIA